MIRIRSRRVATTLAAAALVVPVAGCSAISDSIAGVHAVPTENVGGAPLSAVTAEAITARVLSQKAAAGTAAGATADAARAKVLTGSALVAVNAAVAAKEATPAASPATAPPAPTVLAMSQGKGWPRWILATTLEPETKVQRLHYLTSSAPTSPFMLAAEVPMLGGAQVPSLGAVNAGVAPATAATSLPNAPADVIKAYAAALAYPKPTATQVVAVNDAFATGLRAAAADQTKALGTLAALTQFHGIAANASGTPIVIRLAGGGALVFGQTIRTDTITLGAAAQRLNLPPVVKTLSGKATATKSAKVVTVESLAFVIPASGPARLIGADEQISAASAS